jgi:hypothetical protein
MKESFKIVTLSKPVFMRKTFFTALFATFVLTVAATKFTGCELCGTWANINPTVPKYPLPAEIPGDHTLTFKASNSVVVSRSTRNVEGTWSYDVPNKILRMKIAGKYLSYKVVRINAGILHLRTPEDQDVFYTSAIVDNEHYTPK